MTQLVRLVYISRSTFVPVAGNQTIEPNVARILAKSRKNNRERNVVGGLFFGDGCFLQCLEGDAEVVDALYKKIAADPRHKDVKILSRLDIHRVGFPDWSMKYVPVHKSLLGLLASKGIARFDPYAFTPDLVQAAIDCLRVDADPTAPALAPAASGAPAAVDRPAGGVGAQRPPQGQGAPAAIQLAERSLRLARWALALSSAALLVATGVALRMTF